MKNVKELYLDLEEEVNPNGETYIYGPSDYQQILNEIGEILIQIDDNDYQGDSRVFYEKDGKYGYLIFGWGSCSGCDALQGCNTVEELQNLANGLEHSTRWFDSISEVQEYFNKKDWELEASYHSKETKEFVDKVKKYMTTSDNDSILHS